MEGCLTCYPRGEAQQSRAWQEPEAVLRWAFPPPQFTAASLSWNTDRAPVVSGVPSLAPCLQPQTEKALSALLCLSMS